MVELLMEPAMEFTQDNLNEIEQMLRRAIRELVPEIVHEIVDPRFDNLEAAFRSLETIVTDHSVRLHRLEKTVS